MAEEKELTANVIRITSVPKLKPDAKEHFELLTEQKLSELKENEVLLETEWLSVDPYQRPRMPLWFKQPAKQMESFSIAKVIKSTDANVKVGSFVYAILPWSSRQIVPSKSIIMTVPPNLSEYDAKGDADYVADIDGDDALSAEQLAAIPRSNYIGAFGMPGQTAYYGLRVRGRLQKGESVLISGAAGAVGSVAGQIAKQVFGCRVVGIAGSDAKCAWLRELGFDAAINYKTIGDDYAKAGAALKEAFPDGIDLFFDNVGGIITEAAWDVLNAGARVVVCGQISTYNDGKSNLFDSENDDSANAKLVRPMLHKLIYKEIDVVGIIVTNFKNMTKFYYDMARWIGSGKLKVRETIIEGFEKAPEAFVGLFDGTNIGKMVVKCT